MVISEQANCGWTRRHTHAQSIVRGVRALLRSSHYPRAAGDEPKVENAVQQAPITTMEVRRARIDPQKLESLYLKAMRQGLRLAADGLNLARTKTITSSRTATATKLSSQFNRHFGTSDSERPSARGTEAF